MSPALLGVDRRMLMAALLHDTIEDTTVDYDEVAERFGPEIAQWVAYLTKDMRLAEVEREREYVERLKRAPWQVQVCKLADIFDNLTDSLSARARAHQLARSERYFAELRTITEPTAQRAVTLVGQLIEDVRSKL